MLKVQSQYILNYFDACSMLYTVVRLCENYMQFRMVGSLYLCGDCASCDGL